MLYEAPPVDHRISSFSIGRSFNRRLPVRLDLKSPENRQPTRVSWRKPADFFGDILARLACRRLFRLRLGENFHESGEKHFPFFGGERLPAGRSGVVLHEFLECQPQLGRGWAERAVWIGGHGLISVGGKPFGR